MEKSSSMGDTAVESFNAPVAVITFTESTISDVEACITPAEFVKWKRAYYGGKVLNDTSFNAIFNTYIPTSRPNVSFGLGCALYNPEGSPMCEYHLDRNGGFTSIEGSFPDKNLHYLVLSNRNELGLLSRNRRVASSAQAGRLLRFESCSMRFDTNSDMIAHVHIGNIRPGV